MWLFSFSTSTAFMLKFPFATDQYPVFRRTQHKVTRCSLRGSSLQYVSISPEISYSYLVRETTSGILNKLGLLPHNPAPPHPHPHPPYGRESVSPKAVSLKKVWSLSNHIHRAHKSTSRKPTPYAKGLTFAVALLYRLSLTHPASTSVFSQLAFQRSRAAIFA